MMLELLETGKALYALAAVCVLGVLSRLMARNLYRRLIRETDNMTLTKNRYLRELKQKAENTYRLNQGIHNTQAYLEKQLNGYRFLGLSLNGWGNLGGQLTVLCFFLGGAAAFGAYWFRCDSYYIVLYGATGILGGLLTLFVDYGVNLSERKSQLLNALQDYLENSLFNRLAREAASAMEGNVREVSRDGERENGRDLERGRGVRNLNVRDAVIRNVAGRDAVNRDSSLRDTMARDGGLRDVSIRDGSSRNANMRDDNARDTLTRDAGLREINGRDTARGSGARGLRLRSRDVDNQSDEDALAQNGTARNKKAPRLARKSDYSNQEEAVSPVSQERQAPIRDVDYLRRSLEQIAASREKNSGDGDWIKELSPNELELVGEILKQYLT